MKRLLMAATFCVLLGCGDESKKESDPKIRVRESIGGGVGPVGGGRSREYEGPASQAPSWAKPDKK
jgi:hypothetical protein